ncbi:hypothetical protein [Trinickia fusca]|uniref:Uncharacterized protein n=1 Tax=Trinickia fusca TaxID=2419777 RepID=A0A494X9Z5_9BURK|nr:hypothetical protein [Trinickia fusca]RKP46491.1 hypothetical protein D7S89_17900 [Trinickia fusca]
MQTREQALNSKDVSAAQAGRVDATWQSILSQDVICSASILVDSTSPSPAALFTSQSARSGEEHQVTEALAIVVRDVNDQTARQLCHVARHADSEGGWQLIPLFPDIVPVEVVAATPYATASSSQPIQALFTDGQALYSTALQPGERTWMSPQKVGGQAVSNLRIAYTPLGGMVVYGKTADDNLFVAYQPTMGGAFVATPCNLNHHLASSDFHLCMLDESNWTLAVNANGNPVLYTGMLGATEYASTAFPASFQGTIRKVIFGYWNAQQNALMFLFAAADGSLQVWAENSSNSAARAQPVPNGKIVNATGYIDDNGGLHVYGVDEARTLWVIHQRADLPWDENGLPLWTPAIPLRKDVAALTSDMTQTAEPTLLAFAAADYSMHLHTQDSVSGLWRRVPVLQSSAKAFEVVRFRTEVQITDGWGNPIPFHPVTLKVEAEGSVLDIDLAGKTYRLGRATETPLTADAHGKVTFAVLASAGLSSPKLVLDAPGLDAPMQVVPGQSLHTYLSGKGTLNPTNPGGPLPVFDAAGSTLISAHVGGKALAPGLAGQGQLAATAASAIRQTAALGDGKNTEIVGYAGSLRPGASRFEVFDSRQQLNERLTQLAGGIEPEDFWGDLGKWASDLWEGIKNGVIKLADFVVDAAEKVANLTIEIGDYIKEGIKLAINGIEKAVHFIEGVFNAIAAGIEEVIDWLKALFDFAAIWRTKRALQQALVKTPAYTKSLAGLGRKLADGWFAGQKASVNGVFDREIQKFRGKQFNDLASWCQPGSGNGSGTIVKGLGVDDIKSNVHHNWLQSKIPSSVTLQSQRTSAATDGQDAWAAFVAQLSETGGDLLAAAQHFRDAISDTVQHPGQIGSLAVVDLLQMIQSLVDAGLSLCDALVDGFIALAEDVLDALAALLNQELDLGIFNIVWDWIADLAGATGDDRKLTVAALLSLLAAFPATVIYKLIEGVDTEPFPDGQLPLPISAQAGMSGTPRACRIVAAILRMLTALPAAISEALGPATPGLLSAGSLTLSMLVWGLNNGYPELSMIEWGIAGTLGSQVVWVAPLAYFVMKAKLTELREEYPNEIYDGSLLVFALYGLVAMIYGAYEDAVSPRTPESVVAGVLLPLPSMFPLLLNSTGERESEFAPLFLAADMILVEFGYIGGGGAQLIDAIAS